MRSLLVMVFTAAVSAYAQPGPDTLWTRVYGWAGNDTAFGLEQTFDGGFALAGTATVPASPPHTDIFTIKTNAEGQMLVWRSYGGPGNQGAYDVRQLSDSGYALAGYSTYGVLIVPYAIRLNPYGDTLWTSWCGAGNDAGWLGSVRETVTDEGDTLLAMAGTDRDFSEGWDYTYYWFLQSSTGQGGGQGLGCLPPSRSNDLIEIGGTGPAYLEVGTETDTSGSRAAYAYRLGWPPYWRNHYGGYPFDDEACGAIMTSGGYVLAGTTSDGHLDGVFLCKINTSGDLVWLQRYMGEYAGMARAIIPAIGGGFVVAGSLPTYWGDWDMYLAKFDANGSRQWQRNYGGSGDEQAYDVVQTPDGGFVLVGYTNSWGTGGTDWYIVKTQPDPQLSTGEGISVLPSDYRIAAFPNPFNPITELTFALPQSGQVQVAVFDETGRLVQTLADGPYAVGEHRLIFNGSALTSGIYFARFQHRGYAATQRLVLLK